MGKTVVIYNKELNNLGGGEVIACNIAKILKEEGYKVTLLCEKLVSKRTIWERLGINISSVQIKSIKDFKNNYSRLSSNIDLYINLSQGNYMSGIGKKNVYYVHFPTNPLLAKNIDVKLKKESYINIIQNLRTYQVILANSKYTEKWIKTYWNINADILYPPVKMIFGRNHVDNDQKQKMICSIGRFFNYFHKKKHEVMVRAFIKLHSLGYKDWQLHLIGGLEKNSENKALIKKIKDQAKGYPIYFHFNITRNVLEQILLASKIYWHATGYNENKTKHPFKFEHFGIAPVEAVSAGCSPILYNGGGLREIVSILKLGNKSLFSSINELLMHSVEKIKNKNDYSLFKKRQELLIKNFSYAAFKDRLLSYI